MKAIAICMTLTNAPMRRQTQWPRRVPAIESEWFDRNVSFDGAVIAWLARPNGRPVAPAELPATLASSRMGPGRGPVTVRAVLCMRIVMARPFCRDVYAKRGIWLTRVSPEGRYVTWLPVASAPNGPACRSSTRPRADHQSSAMASPSRGADAAGRDRSWSRGCRTREGMNDGRATGPGPAVSPVP